MQIVFDLKQAENGESVKMTILTFENHMTAMLNM